MARRKQAAPAGAPVVLTVEDVMACLGLSRDKVYDLMNRGGLPYLKLDKSTRILADSLAKWLVERERDTSLSA